MALLADYLRDSQGIVHRIVPSVSGEHLISTNTLLDSLWSEPSYTIPTMIADYRTLADSAGTTWYIYVADNDEIVITTTSPGTVAGIWKDHVYSTVTPTEATLGNEIYLALADENSVDWYVYPNSFGELVISTTEPA